MRWLRGLVVMAILLRFFGLEAMVLVLVLVLLLPVLAASPTAETPGPTKAAKRAAVKLGPPKLTVHKGGKS